VCNKTEKKLLEMYAKKNLGSVEKPPINPCCKECHSTFRGELSKPMSAWIVGNEFNKQEKRVLFIGKIAIGDDGDKFLYPNYRNDDNSPTHYCINVFGVTRENIWNEHSTSFWRFIKDLTRKLFPKVAESNLLEYIAITNLIKCNNSESKANITEYMQFNCVDYLDVVRREIDIINPTHIIFLTGKKYDENICNIFDDIEDKKEIEEPYNNRWCGNGIIGEKTHKFSLLRIRHPQGAEKGLEDIVCKWLETGELL